MYVQPTYLPIKSTHTQILTSWTFHFMTLYRCMTCTRIRIHFTLLHINGTASGARSPSLCKVVTSPFTAAVRRPVCTYVPQSQFMKRISTFYTHLLSSLVHKESVSVQQTSKEKAHLVIGIPPCLRQSHSFFISTFQVI